MDLGRIGMITYFFIGTFHLFSIEKKTKVLGLIFLPISTVQYGARIGTKDSRRYLSLNIYNTRHIQLASPTCYSSRF